MLAYLSRYTHRVAISNRRLVAMDEHGVTFRCKDYRAKGRTRYKTMTLSADMPIVQSVFVCPGCGAAMIVVETFVRGQPIRAPPQYRIAASAS